MTEIDRGIKNPELQLITVAVAGNPNSGKSTLINAIAGTRLYVGNWPGVTVEKKEAVLEFEGRKIKLIDLPGTYSLSPYTQEEMIARDHLLHEKPDVIIDVVDATNLERNLYLTVQLMELGIPMVMALNIYDEAESKGYEIDTKTMEKVLGIKVIPTISTKRKGLDELLKTIIEVFNESPQYIPKQLNYGEDIETAAETLQFQIHSAYPVLAERYPLRWLAFKLMEGDEYIHKVTKPRGIDLRISDAMSHLKKAHGEDIESMMADARYAHATGLTHQVLKKPEIGSMELTEKIDKIVLNRFLGIPVFLAAMWLIFKLAFDVSTPFVDWIVAMMSGPFKRWTEALLGFINAPEWTVSLATDGVISGAGFVLVFVPVIGMMMLLITFLESSGYMARAAFVMDRVMHTLGLHGKSFIPMLLGFGCNVPSVYATRILENERDKKLTTLLVPLMSCGARLPVYVVFIGAFFQQKAGTVLWSMYVLGIVVAILLGIVLRRTFYKGESPMFIMELPPYRIPTFRDLMIHTWQKLRHFVVKAGTYIVAVSILVWFMLNIPWGVENKKDSALGMMGQAIAPVFKPLGFGNWEASSSLISGVIAKEIVVGTMSEIYALKTDDEKREERPTFTDDLKEVGVSFLNASKDAAVNVISGLGIASITAEESEEEKEERSPLRQAIQGVFTPLSAYAFIAFVLLYWPCVVVGIATRQEFGTWKIFGQAVLIHTTLAWIVAFVIYQGGRVLGLE
ncbi:MAG: ferrous iron transport protein B [Thermodesulfobacteriota bacterium]|nr:ferrous iron transport protein B [Thermodesulfobacteriota bacterium]